MYICKHINILSPPDVNNHCIDCHKKKKKKKTFLIREIRELLKDKVPTVLPRDLCYLGLPDCCCHGRQNSLVAASRGCLQTRSDVEFKGR